METYACKKTMEETPKVNCVNCFLSPFNLIFKAVKFNTLGGVKPKKEKAKTNKKREIILSDLIMMLSFLFFNNYL